jgi:hypothetical protein
MSVVLAAIVKLFDYVMLRARDCVAMRHGDLAGKRNRRLVDSEKSSTSLSFGFPFISHLLFFSTHPPYYGFVRCVYLRVFDLLFV